MKNYATISMFTVARRQSALLLLALATAACAPSGGKGTAGDGSTTEGDSDSETVGDKPDGSSTTQMPDPTTGTESDPTYPDSCSSGCGIDIVCNVESDPLKDEPPCATDTHCEASEDECGCPVRACVADCKADSCPAGEFCEVGSGLCLPAPDPNDCSSGCSDFIECQPEGSDGSTGDLPACESGFHCDVSVDCGCTVAQCLADCDPADPTSCPAGKVCDEQTGTCRP